MNLFVIGWSLDGKVDTDAARRAVSTVVAALPRLRGQEVNTWSSASGHAGLACAAHSPDRTAGVSYQALNDDAMAIFTGRPIAWTSDSEADGRAPLDPRFYLRSPDEWADSLDGRFAVATYDGEKRVLHLLTDPLGAYPVYEARSEGTRWLSNNVEALRTLIASNERRASVLASFLGCGWSLGGAPLWKGVDRLPRGTLHSFGADGEKRVAILPTETLGTFFGHGFDPESAGQALISTVRAGGDWPGRPAILPLTGGRDSRVVFAATLGAGLHFEAETSALPHLPGYPDTGDVTIARQLCEEVGRPHRVNLAQTELDLVEAQAAVRLASPGTFSFGGLSPGAVAAFSRPPGPQDREPLRLLLTGAAGEVSRAYYGLGEGLDAPALVDKLYVGLVRRFPQPILSRDGEQMVRTWLTTWVGEQMARGIAKRDVPDAFYLLERMANWAGPLQGLSEYNGDTHSPLWSRAVVRQQLGLPGADRSNGAFHRLVLDRLAPHLQAFPYEGADYSTGPRARLVSLAKKGRTELRRRFGRAALTRESSPDVFVGALPQVREAVASSSPQHPAWGVLDRRRVMQRLDNDPARLDPRSREQVWRLATVFLAVGS